MSSRVARGFESRRLNRILDHVAADQSRAASAIFGGYVKPANWNENCRDRRLVENQTGRCRHVVVIMRERNGFRFPSCSRAKRNQFRRSETGVHPEATIHADRAAGRDVLHERFLTKRINHEECYSDGDACTNQAESFFSRIRPRRDRDVSPYQRQSPWRLCLRNGLARR